MDGRSPTAGTGLRRPRAAAGAAAALALLAAGCGGGGGDGEGRVGPVVYRTDVFADLGLDGPTAWEELRE